MSTYNIKDFHPQKGQLFVMDTNVLIKLLYPLLSSSNTIAYENLYAAIHKKQAKVIISAIQVSEFINRCIRFQFDIWRMDQDKDADFKNDYRNTDNYRNAMQAILDIIIYDLSPNVTYIDDGFSQMDQGNLYQYGFSYDFNDAIVAEIARLNQAVLITDDRDFANYSANIDIVTGNRALLMFNKH